MLNKITKSLENRISKSVQSHGILGLGLIPGALVFDASKYIKDTYEITTGQIISTYAQLALVESTKTFVYYNIMHDILKNLL